MGDEWLDEVLAILAGLVPAELLAAEENYRQTKASIQHWCLWLAAVVVLGIAVAAVATILKLTAVDIIVAVMFVAVLGPATLWNGWRGKKNEHRYQEAVKAIRQTVTAFIAVVPVTYAPGCALLVTLVREGEEYTKWQKCNVHTLWLNKAQNVGWRVGSFMRRLTIKTALIIICPEVFGDADDVLGNFAAVVNFLASSARVTASQDYPPAELFAAARHIKSNSD